MSQYEDSGRMPAASRSKEDDKEYQEYLEYLKFLESQKSNPETSNGYSILEEMHPDLKGDRFAVKNFGHAEEARQENIDYIKKRHPDLIIEERDGRIVARRPDEKDFRVLDPNTGLFSSDMIRDGLDVAIPTLQGLVEGGAAAAGSVAGLPGAVAAAGGAGFLTEKLRQWMSQNLGLYQKPNNFEVGLNTGLNAAFPVAGRAISIGANKVFPYVANVFSGVPAKAIQTTLKRLPELDALESDGSLFDFQEAAKRKISEPLFTALQQKGSDLSNEIRKAGGYVEVDPKPLFDVVDRLKSLSQEGRLKTDALKSEVASAENFLKAHFSHTRKPFKTYSEVTEKVPGSVVDDFGNLHTKLPILPDPPPETVYSLSSLKNEPNTSAIWEHMIRAHAQTPVMVPKTKVIKDVVTPSPEFITKLDPEAAWELQKRVGDLADYSKLPPTPGMVSPRNMTDQVRALDDIYAALNDGLSNVTGGASQKIKNEYKQLSDLRRLIRGHFGTPERSYQSLTNLDGKSKTMLKRHLEKAKELTGLDVSKDADLLAAQAHFGDKAHGGSGLNWMPISGGGTTSTSRSLLLSAPRMLLDAAGLTLATGSPLGFLGMPLVSPRAMKTYTRGIYNSNQALKNPAINFGARATPPTLWHLLHEADRQPGE